MYSRSFGLCWCHVSVIIVYCSASIMRQEKEKTKEQMISRKTLKSWDISLAVLFPRHLPAWQLLAQTIRAERGAHQLSVSDCCHHQWKLSKLLKIDNFDINMFFYNVIFIFQTCRIRCQEVLLFLWIKSSKKKNSSASFIVARGPGLNN